MSTVMATSFSKTGIDEESERPTEWTVETGKKPVLEAWCLSLGVLERNFMKDQVRNDRVW